MACFQILSEEDTKQAIDWAAKRKMPLTVTVRDHNRWLTCESWLVGRSNGFMWIDYPMFEGEPLGGHFQIGEKINVIFRVYQRRCVFAVTVLGRAPHVLTDGSKSTALKVTFPESMQRVERRREDRVQMPASQIARATFWLGGRDVRPAIDSLERPVWSGKVVNLSKGGAYVRASLEAAKYLEVGDLMGFCFSVGEGEDREEIVVDAQFRHSQPDSEMALLGFEFIDLGESEEARESLDLLWAVVEALRAARGESGEPKAQDGGD